MKKTLLYKLIIKVVILDRITIFINFGGIMKGYYEMKWPLHLNVRIEPTKENFGFEQIEKTMQIKLPKDFKEFLYRNSQGMYPDMDTYYLYDEKGEKAIGLVNLIVSYINIESIIRSQEIAREDIGEIYYWHLPILTCGQERIAFDYTHCKEILQSYG